MDPLYEQRLRDEVIYLHSLWHQGPPGNRNRTGADAHAVRRHLQPLETNRIKKRKKRKHRSRSKAREFNSSPGAEWPCLSPPHPSSSNVWPTWVVNNNADPISLTPGDESRWASRCAHKQAIRVVHEFFKRNSSDDPDEICTSSDEDDVLMEEDGDVREEYNFFWKVFGENIELRQYYEKNFATGEFSCLVCGAVGGKNEGKKYKGCLALVQHSITIARTKKRRAHRALGQTVCKVLGWDIDQLHAIVSMLSANGERGGNSNNENAGTSGNPAGTAEVDSEKAAPESCSIGAENLLQADDGCKGNVNSDNIGTPRVNTVKTPDVNNERITTESDSFGPENLITVDDMGNANTETIGLPVNGVNTANVCKGMAAPESCSIGTEKLVDDGIMNSSASPDMSGTLKHDIEEPTADALTNV